MKSILVLLFAICSWSALRAGEDTLPAKTYTLRYDYWSINASRLFDEQRHRQNLEHDFQLDRQDMSLHYGLYESVTLILDTSYLDQSWMDSDTVFSTKGFGSAYFAVKQKIPSSYFGQFFYSEIGVVIPQGYDEKQALPLGSGGIDWVILGTYAQKFNPNQSGVELEIGYIFRNGAPEDEVRIRTDFHLGITKNSHLHLRYATRESKSNNQIEYNPLVYPIDQGVQKGGVEFRLGLSPKWMLIFEAESSFRGRNQFKTEGYGLGLRWAL